MTNDGVNMAVKRRVIHDSVISVLNGGRKGGVATEMTRSRRQADSRVQCVGLREVIGGVFIATNNSKLF